MIPKVRTTSHRVLDKFYLPLLGQTELANQLVGHFRLKQEQDQIDNLKQAIILF